MQVNFVLSIPESNLALNKRDLQTCLIYEFLLLIFHLLMRALDSVRGKGAYSSTKVSRGGPDASKARQFPSRDLHQVMG